MVKLGERSESDECFWDIAQPYLAAEEQLCSDLIEEAMVFVDRGVA